MDDDAILRMDMAEFLANVGFDTLEAEDDETALLALKQHHLDDSLLFPDVEIRARETALPWPTRSR